MDIEELSAPLTIDQIDFRVQSINKGGYATISAYKDARVDINRLNAVCGHLGWSREHKRDNHNCVVSIWDEDANHWVSKEDTGTESAAEAQKGLASDSFKRACFNWGIGLELYDYPVIQIKLKDNEWEMKEWNGKQSPKATWNLKVRDWVWYSEFEDGKLSFLAAIDGEVTRFKWGKKIGIIAGDLIDIAKIDKAVKWFHGAIEADKDEDEIAPKIKEQYNKLTNDEQVEVNNKLKSIKVEGRQCNTLLAAFLKWEPTLSSSGELAMKAMLNH